MKFEVTIPVTSPKFQSWMRYLAFYDLIASMKDYEGAITNLFDGVSMERTDTIDMSELVKIRRLP